jgi:hypothetical protein
MISVSQESANRTLLPHSRFAIRYCTPPRPKLIFLPRPSRKRRAIDLIDQGGSDDTDRGGAGNRWRMPRNDGACGGSWFVRWCLGAACLIMLRAMFGLTGHAVTNDAIGANATRTTWQQMPPCMNGNCGASFAQ